MTQNSGEPDIFQNWLSETLAINGEPEIPDVLYKFVSCESKYFALSAHELLLHSRIRLSSRSEFNDPFDTVVKITPPTIEEMAHIIITANGNSSEVLDSLPQMQSSLRPERFIESISRSLDELGIFSLAAKIHNPLMWAHYGCSHKGLAFVFSQNSLNAIGALPVRYERDNKKIVPFNYHAIALAAMSKGYDWLYESEWRVVQPSQAKKWIKIEPTVLKGVVFGAKCNSSDKEFIEELIARRIESQLPDLEIYTASIDNDEFELQFKKTRSIAKA
ncbi:MAG TPA: DUF2971 domain-containing protein [Arenimonas sp.]|nr:DUF2971 domain-containing protein [Arenimonas sp.]HOZ04550.1 DUF2971 domain-containing protein [Arenimonas sp.]